MKILINENQYNIVLQEELFRFNQLSSDEQERLFNIFRDSYVKSTGTSWNKEKFYNKVNDYIFFGDKNDGFITLKIESDGTLKLTTAAGDLKHIFDGVNEVVSLNKPVWGMMSGKLAAVMTKKYNFIIPPNEVTKFLVSGIMKSYSNDNFKFNDNGSFTINYNDIGNSTKFFVANKQYYKFLLNKIIPNSEEIPYFVTYFLNNI